MNLFKKALYVLYIQHTFYIFESQIHTSKHQFKIFLSKNDKDKWSKVRQMVEWQCYEALGPLGGTVTLNFTVWSNDSLLEIRQRLLQRLIHYNKDRKTEKLIWNAQHCILRLSYFPSLKPQQCRNTNGMSHHICSGCRTCCIY